ncbi:glycosyltransferase [Roseateles oligotrophus]|uniref:Glycosyl transferase family 1 n=1 Tax=Roseateles oligotrophus TaxID=1769250 RepID=A0ABT2YFB8_9BURK|nr:glycosyl transferase family 1 [Roseateles oligotrophus]MCV2368716.1 glycosyl transferase family 1 [Roseateles oligotrophus]
MKKILFVAEAVSLAHVARPSILARSLDREKYEVVFASNEQFKICTENSDWQTYPVESISPELFMQRLAKGQPVYTEHELAAYVAADIRMLEAVRPDAVVGDFRLSLAIAARLLKVPLFIICNAYWSAFAADQRMHAPDLPAAKIIGFPIFDRVFRLVWPFASRLHCIPINRVRKKYGFKPYRSIREYYGDGDVVMYSDTPGLVPATANLPPTHHYIGPIVWSPSMALPAWWAEAMAIERPRAYITLGSTGSVDLLPEIVAACLEEGLLCLVATAGRGQYTSDSPWVFTAPFLPGDLAAAAASLVICNGGSPTTHQALQQGVPVLGICSNLDQVMNMSGIKRSGAGIGMRAGEFSRSGARKVISILQGGSYFKFKTSALALDFNLLNSAQQFTQLLARYTA